MSQRLALVVEGRGFTPLSTRTVSQCQLFQRPWIVGLRWRSHLSLGAIVPAPGDRHAPPDTMLVLRQCAPRLGLLATGLRIDERGRHSGRGRHHSGRGRHRSGRRHHNGGRHHNGCGRHQRVRVSGRIRRLSGVPVLTAPGEVASFGIRVQWRTRVVPARPADYQRPPPQNAAQNQRHSGSNCQKCRRQGRRFTL